MNNSTTPAPASLNQATEALRRSRLVDGQQDTPRVAFAPLPAGEVVHVDRVDGILHVTIDKGQLLTAATEVTGA